MLTPQEPEDTGFWRHRQGLEPLQPLLETKHTWLRSKLGLASGKRKKGASCSNLWMVVLTSEPQNVVMPLAVIGLHRSPVVSLRCQAAFSSEAEAAHRVLWPAPGFCLGCPLLMSSTQFKLSWAGWTGPTGTPEQWKMGTGRLVLQPPHIMGSILRGRPPTLSENYLQDGALATMRLTVGLHSFPVFFPTLLLWLPGTTHINCLPGISCLGFAFVGRAN